MAILKNLIAMALKPVLKLVGKDNQIALLRHLLFKNVRQSVWVDSDNQKLFYDFEKIGFHILPVHFYSPLPDTGTLADAVWEPYDTADMGYDDEAMLKLLTELSQYKTEVMDIPMEQVDRQQYYYNNIAFNGMDAVMYYYMIRHFKPAKLVEIGSGYSTLIAAKAVLQNESENINTIFTAIEPYPMDFLLNDGGQLLGLHKLIPEFLQNIPLSFFEELESGDILFIDSTHVSKIGSDVNYIFLKILPLLKPGVIIHFHDIFLPNEMPKEWVKNLSILWNEQYLLHTLLIAKGEFKTLMPNNYIGSRYESDAKKYMPALPYYMGGSYWIRKVEKG